MSTHGVWGQRDAFTYTNDPSLDRERIARANLKLMQARGFPISVIIEQLSRTLPICRVCGAEREPGRETCSRSCTMRLRWSEKKSAPVCLICGGPRRAERKTCSRRCANILRAEMLREKAHPARAKAAV